MNTMRRSLTSLNRIGCCLLFLFLLGSCNDDDDNGTPDPEPAPNRLELTWGDPEAIGSTETFTYSNINGAISSDAIQIETGFYSVQARVLDASNAGNPIDLTQDILTQGEDYKLFYNYPEDVVEFFQYSDFDAVGSPIGISSGWNVSDPSQSGDSIVVRLVQGLDKSLSQNQGNQWTEAVEGEVLLRASFALNVQ